MKNKISPAGAALLTAALLLILSIICILCLLPPEKTQYTAQIYQDGTLVMSIPLDDVAQPRQFTLYGENGCSNTVEVRPGSIGIVAADCPDKICVQQGFLQDSRLPITCLPNRLVITLQPSREEDDRQLDGITH